MRKILWIVLCLAATSVLAGDEVPWFELENCAMCKNLAAEPGLLEHVSREVYATHDGMMTVATVPSEYAKAYKNAKMHMQETSAKLMAGEKLPLCGYCQSFMAIMGTGKATMEPFETAAGDVMLVSSNDEATIAQIHAHTERTLKEMKMMEGSR